MNEYYERPGDKIYPKDDSSQLEEQKPWGRIEYYFVKSTPDFPHFSVTISLYNVPKTITTFIYTYERIGRSEVHGRGAKSESKEEGKIVYVLGLRPEEYIKVSFGTENRSQYRQTNVYRARRKELYLDQNLSDIAIIYVPLELLNMDGTSKRWPKLF